MKFKISTLAAALAVAVSTQAYAAQGQGWYIGGKVGAASPTISTSSDINHASFGINGGYNWEINNQFFIGLQVGLNSLGSMKSSLFDNARLSISTIELLATAHYIYNQFDWFIKGGTALQSGTWSDKSPYVVYNDGRLKGSSPVLAAGAGYYFQPNWEIYAEYAYYFGSNLTGALNADGSMSHLRFSTGYIGIKYNF